MNKNTIFEYLGTIFKTITGTLILIFLVIGIIQYQVSVEQYNQPAKDEPIDYAMVAILIDENLYLEQKHPENYKINLKLGFLYELRKDYKNAEIQYKAAISKAPLYEFKPHFSLAQLYLINDNLEAAQKTMDNIGEKPDPKLIKYKAEIYTILGDKYYDLGDYEEASLKYQKAITYYNLIKSKKGKTLERNLASAYVYLADEKVGEMRIEDAISYLTQASAIIEAPIIKYKLALLLMTSNPELSYKYYNEVFEEQPAIINYDTFYNFLSDLSLRAEEQGKFAEAKLYRYKIDRLKAYYDSNIISIDDIAIEDIQGKVSIDKWKHKYNVDIKLQFRNVSNYTINILFLDIVFKEKDRIIDSYTKQVIDKKSELTVNAQSPLINIKTSTNKIPFDSNPKEITIQILASKGKDSYKILLKEVNVTEKIKHKKNIFKRILQKLGFRLL